MRPDGAEDTAGPPPPLPALPAVAPNAGR